MRMIIGSTALMLAAASAGSAQVTNTELGYTMTAPPGFVGWPEGRNQPDYVDCWKEAEPAEGMAPITLCVQRLGGTLDREPMKQEDLGAPNLTLTSFRWNELEIEGVESSATPENGNAIGFVAQVPLEGEAIQVVVRAPTEQKARARAVMNNTLNGLIGDSDWLSSMEIAERYGRITGKFLVGALVAGFGLWMRRRRRRDTEFAAA
jgi:hypothetical protein